VGENAVQIDRALPDDLIIVSASAATREVVGDVADMYSTVAGQAVRGELDSPAAIQNALDQAQVQAASLFVAQR
jgi:hypothetical protein